MVDNKMPFVVLCLAVTLFVVVSFAFWGPMFAFRPDLPNDKSDNVSTYDAAVSVFEKHGVRDSSDYIIKDVSDPDLEYDEFEFTPRDMEDIEIGGQMAFGVDKKSKTVVLLSD